MGGDNAIAFSDSIALTPFDTISPLPPSITFVSVPVNGKTQINWQKSASNDVRNYTIYHQTATGYKPIATVGDVSIFVDSTSSTLSSNCYEVQAVDSCAKNVSTLSAPHCSMALSVSNNGCERANYLTWNSYSGWAGISKYEVYRSVNGGAESLLASLASGTFYKDSGLSFHNNYCYRIKAYESASTNTSYSNTFCKQVYFVDTPYIVVVTKLNSSASAGKVKVQWTSQKGKPHLAYYKLYYSSTGAKPFTLLKDSIPIAQDTFIHSGINTKVGEHYYYLQTIDSCGTLSEISAIHKTMDFTFHVGQLVHQLNWTPYKGWPVKYYVVQHGTGLTLTNEDTLTGTDTSLHKFPAPCNTRVVYRVLAVSYTGVVSYSDSMGGQAIDTIPTNAPTLENVSVISGSLVRLDFLGSDSLDTYGYSVQRSQNGGSFTTAGFVHFTSAHAAQVFVDTVNTLNDRLCYQLIGLDSCLNASPSQVMCAIQLTGAPGNLLNNLNWYNYKGYGINHYEVMIYQNGAWQNLNNSNLDTFFTHQPLSCNVPRYYRIEGYGTSGFNTFSDSIALTPFDTTRPLAPSINYVSVLGPTSVTVNWNYSPSAKVKLYEVQYKSPNGAYKVFTTVSLQKSVTVTGLNTHDSAYSFRVIAIDSCAANRSFPSNVHQSILLTGTKQNLASKLDWSAYGGFGVNRYVIFKWMANVWKRIDSVNGATNTYTDKGLSCNVTYSYKILAYSSVGGFASYGDSVSVTPFDTTRPLAPTLNSVSVLGPGSVSVNWSFSPSTKVKQYEVQYKSPNGTYQVFTTVTLQKNVIVTGLNTHDSAYSFRVIAIDTCAGNRSFPSNVHQSILLKGTKQNLASKLDWSAYGGFTVNRYVIFKWVAGAWKRIDSVSGTTLTYTDKGLSCNVSYSYKLLAYSATGGFSSYADSVSVTPFDTTRPIAPVINYATVLNKTSVFLNWNFSASSKVKQYEVQFKSKTGTYRVFTTLTLKNSVTVTGLDPHDTAYDFEVIAIDTCAGNRSLTPGPAPQTILLTGNNGNLLNTLNWTPYIGFTTSRYIIYKYLNGKWVKTDSVSGTTSTYTDTGLACNIPYYYKVQAISNVPPFTSYSDSISLTPYNTIPPKAPVINYATVVSPTSILLNWNYSTSKTVKQYEIQYKSPNGPYKVFATLTLQKSIVITGLKTHDSAYDFRIVAIDTCSGARSAFSQVHQSILLGGKAKNDADLLTWSAYQGFTVNRYLIYKKVSNVWTKTDSVLGAATSYLDTGLSCNVTRYYKVLAISNNPANTSYSDSIALTPYDSIAPPTPSIQYATVLNGKQIQLFWNKSVPKVKLYELWLKSASGPWINYFSLIDGYNFVVSGLNTIDSTYSFRIDVKDTCAGNKSQYSPIHTVINIKGVNGDQRNTLNWSPYQGFASVKKYYIYLLENNVWTKLDSVSGSSLTYLHNPAACNVPKNYKVAALDNTGQYLAFSDSIQLTPFDTIKPQPPILYNATVLPNSTVQVNWHWDRTTDVTKFEVWRSQSGGAPVLAGQVKYDSSFIDKNVNPKIAKLAYYVIAIDSCSNLNRSKPSNTDTVIQPHFKTGGCRAYFQLSWTPYSTLPGGVDHYEIYKSKNGAPYTFLTNVTSPLIYTDYAVDSFEHFSYYLKAVSKTSPITSNSDTIGIQPWQYAIPKASSLSLVSVYKTSPTNGAVKALWQPYPFALDTVAKGYRLYFSYSKTGPYKLILNTKNEATTSFILNGINTTDSTSYFYLKVFNTCNLEGDSNSIQSPPKLQLTNKDLEVDLAWKPYEGMPAIKNYNIYRSEDGAYYGLLSSVASNTFNYHDTSVSCEHIYTYRVSAVSNDISLPEAFSDSAGVKAFDTVKAPKPIIYYATTSLTDKDSGAIVIDFKGNTKRNRAGYAVYYATDGVNFSLADSSKETGTDTIVWKQHRLNTVAYPYSFYLRAFDSCGNLSTPSDTQTVVHLAVTAKSHADILNWSPYIGFKNLTYMVQRKTAGTPWVPLTIMNATQLTYTDSLVKCDTFYIYRIVTQDLDFNNNLSLSNLSGVTAFDTDAPKPPVILYVSTSVTSTKNGKIDIAWNKSVSPDVAYYNIYRRNPVSNIWEAIATHLTNTTYTDSGLNTYRQEYEYQIEALDSCRNPNLGNSIIHNSMVLHAIPGNQSIDLSWDAYKGWQPMEYDIYRDGKLIGKAGAGTTSFVDSPAACPIVYHYMVKAIQKSDSIISAVSNIDSAQPFDHVAPVPPYLIRATVSQPNNQVSLEWVKSKDFDLKGYKVQRRISPMNYYEVIYTTNDPNDTTYTDVLSNLGDSLCYIVTAFDHCGNTSQQSNPGCVIIVQGEARALSNILHWNDYQTWPGGVDHYNLYRKTDDTAGYKLLQEFTNPVFIYNDTGFVADGDHYCYRIEAVEKGGFAAHSWSTELCLTQAPVVWIPNAFTPEMSLGINDLFGPKGLFMARYDMDIYNRWGQRLFYTDKSKPWDGSFQGRQVGEGVYLYHITVFGHDNKPYYFEGTVEILK